MSGDKLRVDLRKKDVPATKMLILEQKFDDVKINGLLLPSALNSAVSNNDELDNAGQVKSSRLVKRTVSSSVRKPQSLDVSSKYLFSKTILNSIFFITFINSIPLRHY